MVLGRFTPLLLVGLTFGLQAQAPDKYVWLEDVTGERAMAWVKAENERTAAVLQADPRFAGLQADALKVLESPDRLPTPALNGSDVYNTWQDATHVKGILRRTSVSDYLTSEPHWHTVIDYDALAKQDDKPWVQKGLNCLYPGNEHCLVSLSAGGEDAAIEREFNLKTGKFVVDGFVLPRAKHNIAWIDKDTLLVASDWGPGTLTQSGYPFVVKLWKRAQPLEQATEVYRGTQTDFLVAPLTLSDAKGHHASLMLRGLNFFDFQFWLLTEGGVKQLALPAKVEINGLLDGHLIATLNEDWQPVGSGAKLVQGSIFALELAAVESDPAHLKPTVIFQPGAKEFAQSVSFTKDQLLLTTLENVQGRAYVYSVSERHVWSKRKLSIPDNQTVSIDSTNWSDNRFFLSLNGFLTPPSLFLGDATSGVLNPAKAQRAQFDASAAVVEQLSAISKDGTKVPYFVVHRKDIKYDGANPTLMTAYGGFQISNTPKYTPTIGKLWLERGGVFVLANIRGGGEFGPAWHEAGLKTHRQRIYDDFAAVGQDLVTRRITSPRRLGIVGGSNGGLLMGVEMTQHPEMWNAIVIDIPLLDMLGFEHIAAGASWIGEYGSTSVPAERDFLATISPYNRLSPDVNYPEPLLFTTTKDDRVGPVHARKFAAKMEEFHKPFYFDEITEGGHGSGANLKEDAATLAVRYTYLTRKLMD